MRSFANALLSAAAAVTFCARRWLLTQHWAGTWDTGSQLPGVGHFVWPARKALRSPGAVVATSTASRTSM
jgi:hypothetical protein